MKKMAEWVRDLFIRKCCDRQMRRVDLLTHWCGNCGTIRSRWLCRGRIGPNLRICATCKHWGPEGSGATRVCHVGAPTILIYTSPGVACKSHRPVNPPLSLR